MHAHTGVVWTMKFSRNGKFLATAGQDGIVRVWEIILNRGEPVNNTPCALLAMQPASATMVCKQREAALSAAVPCDY